MRYLWFIVVAVVCFGAGPTAAARAAQIPASAFAQLTFRNIGPLSGRIDAVSGVPGSGTTFYAGGLGGIFKTADAGITWSPVFEHEPVSSIGALAVAPSAPDVVYAGTGEANLRNDVAFGDGVWKSSDAGKTWQHAGLRETGHIAAIAVDPGNAAVAYVAALGTVYKPSTARGVYRTTDGGKSWQRVLYVDERTGASSIAIDPGNARHLIAGMWEGWRTPYHLNSGGPNDGLYASTDGGTHWTRLTGHGLPAGPMGRIAVAFAPSNPKRVYALIESKAGTLWRSDDGGANWTLVNTSHGIDQRPFYFTSLTVDPSDQNHVFFMSVRMWQTTDGGKTVSTMQKTRGGDYHALWIDPRDAHRMVAGDDQGTEVSFDGGRSWLDADIAIAQSYHVDTDERVPYTVCSEDQDAGSACAPSNSLAAGGIAPSQWFSAGGGESGWIRIDKRDSNIIYGTGYTGSVTRYDRRSQQAQDIAVWPLDSMGWGAAGLKYRFTWTAPIALSPHGRTLYMGGNRLFATRDGGRTWRAISPDLTRDDKARQGPSGGPITLDNTSVEYYDTIFSIAPSPRRAGEIWVGTDDGLVWLTRDGGAHWHNLSANVPHLAPWGRVDYVDPSPFHAGTAYMAVDYHKSGDRAPYLFKTTDFGKRWTAISSNLPAGSYARMIKADPFRPGLLYAGTETGLYLSFDDGAHWQPFQNGLPTVPVYDFTVQKPFDDLVVGTHGRALWILDDLRPLQELTPRVMAKPSYLFALRPAYRWRIGAYTNARWTGANPPYGADVNVYLAAPPKNGASVKVQISAGTQIVRTLTIKKPVAGVNRLWWDLRYSKLEPVKGYVPWNRGGFAGPLVLPGTYTVRVLGAGSPLARPLQVREDPRSHASLPALRAQLAFLMRVRADLQRMTQSIELLDARKTKAPAGQAAQIDRLLHRLYNPEVTQGEDALRYPIALYGRLSSLAGAAASADAAPTAAEEQVLRVLEGQMDSSLGAVRAFLASKPKP